MACSGVLSFRPPLLLVWECCVCIAQWTFWQANNSGTWHASDVNWCESALFPVSVGYGDYVIVFNLRASVGGEQNIRGQRCVQFEFTIVVILMWVRLPLMGSILPWAPMSSLALSVVFLLSLCAFRAEKCNKHA